MTASVGAPERPPAASTSPADPARPTDFGYKPALDGLRAVAVLSVLAYHFGAGWLQGGFLGVDLFFVLSGYLITSLLLLEWNRTDTIHFGAFWARRARRLLPALFLVLLAIALWGRFAQTSDEWNGLRWDSIWTLFYGANWHFVASGQSYFEAAVGGASMLRHAWSLAIEEQFYLVWPLVVFACVKLTRGRHVALAVLCVVGSIASIAIMQAVYHSGGDPSRAYYGTDARASQLFIGALLGIALIHWTPRDRMQRMALQVIGVVGAVVVLTMFWATRDREAFLYRGGFVLFAIAAALVIAAIVQPTRNPLRSVLCIRPIRWIGAVSYGVYLWHWPVSIALTKARLAHWGWSASGWEVAVLRVTATFAIAALSYYLVELPIRQRRFARRWTPRVLVPVAFAATLAVILVASAGATSSILQVAPGEVIRSDKAPTPVTTVPGAAIPPTQRLLLLGDSVAASMSDAIQTTAAQRGVTFVSAARAGCGMTTGINVNDDGTVIPWSENCAKATVKDETDAVRQAQPDTVLWHSSWELGHFQVDGEVLSFGTPAWTRWMTSEMDRVRTLVTENGARLVFVTMPPSAPNPLREVSTLQVQRTEQMNDLMRAYAKQHPDEVTVVDLAAIVCPGGTPCPTTRGGVTLRPKDGGHYEPEGAAWVAPRLLDALFAQLDTWDSTTPTNSAPTNPAPTNATPTSTGR